MIKVCKKNNKVTLKIPKTYKHSISEYLLIICDREKGFEWKGTFQDSSIISNFYKFEDLDLNEIPDGEYTYIVKGYLEDKGIIRIGDLKNVINKKYDNKRTIIQYGD